MNPCTTKRKWRRSLFEGVRVEKSGVDAFRVRRNSVRTTFSTAQR